VTGLLTLRECAERTGIAEGTILSSVRSLKPDRLRTVRDSRGQHHVDPAELERWLASRQGKRAGSAWKSRKR